MTDRLQAAEMNVAVCRALGIDPEGISSLRLTLDHDDWPRIEVTYSAKYIAELELAGDDDDNSVTSRYAYELIPIETTGFGHTTGTTNATRGVSLTTPDTVGQEWATPTPTPTPTPIPAEGVPPGHRDELR